MENITEEEIKEIIEQLEIAVQLADLEEKPQELTLILFGREYPVTVEERDRPKIRCFKCHRMTANFVIRYFDKGETKAKLCRKCAKYYDGLVRANDVDKDLYFKKANDG